MSPAGLGAPVVLETPDAREVVVEPAPVHPAKDEDEHQGAVRDRRAGMGGSGAATLSAPFRSPTRIDGVTLDITPVHIGRRKREGLALWPPLPRPPQATSGDLNGATERPAVDRCRSATTVAIVCRTSWFLLRPRQIVAEESRTTVRAERATKNPMVIEGSTFGRIKARIKTPFFDRQVASSIADWSSQRQ